MGTVFSIGLSLIQYSKLAKLLDSLYSMISGMSPNYCSIAFFKRVAQLIKRAQRPHGWFLMGGFVLFWSGFLTSEFAYEVLYFKKQIIFILTFC